MSMRISIAMATYNGARYLQPQLDSFITQTRQPDELIITDDGSTDNTLQIIEDFSKNAPFTVHYSRNEKNLGYAGNFNAALMKTTGDLVFLSDQDDVWFDDKIARIAELNDKHQDKLVFMNDAELTDGELNKVGLTKLGQIRSAGMGDHAFVMGCCCAVRRELLDLCMPVPQGYTSHDVWLVGFADGMNAKMVYGHALQYYRRHGSNTSSFIANRTTRLNRWHMYFDLVRRIGHLSNPDVSEQHLQQLELFLQGVVCALNRNNPNYTKQLEAMLKDKQSGLAHEKTRLAIRSKPFFSRFSSVMSYMHKGGYRHPSGVKNAVRDLMG